MIRFLSWASLTLSVPPSLAWLYMLPAAIDANMMSNSVIVLSGFVCLVCLIGSTVALLLPDSY